MQDPPLIIAKAGGAAEYPENTRLAIEATVALSRCARRHRVALEVDVRSSRDGHLVVHHDATLDRTTNGRGRVDDHDLSALDELRTKEGNHRLITLRNAWESAGDLELIVELHDEGATTLRALCDWLQDLGTSSQERVVVASERAAAVAAIRERVPTVRTSATAWEALALLVCAHLGLKGRAPRGQIWMVPPRFRGLDVLHPRLLRAARDAGDPVWAWVIDDAQQARELFARGVDGVFSTRPHALVAELEGKLAERGPAISR
ncbi:MAG: glycerophosphodiester phosphodiesterase family protein [Polyangiaceae bacterium]